MTRLASFLVASYRRPHLLRECIDHLVNSDCPPGWEFEIAVSIPADDPGREVLLEKTHPVMVREINPLKTNVAAQYTAALSVAKGEFLVVCGDDDLLGKELLYESICGYEGGAVLTGVGRFLFFSRTDGSLAWWDGPLENVGAARGYSANILRTVGGWGSDFSRNLDSGLNQRIRQSGLWSKAKRLPNWIGENCVFTDGDDNISKGRPFPVAGESVEFGNFVVTGAGNDVIDSLPDETREALLRISLCDQYQ